MDNLPIELKIIASADGSHTLFRTGLNETYHSTHGAVQESEHVYIQAGLAPLLARGKSSVSIFEVGFGTGLNAWLTYKYCQNIPCSILYHSLEPFPIKKEVYANLNYTSGSNDETLIQFFTDIHESSWETECILSKTFSLKKTTDRLETYQLTNQQFDLVFFDAFAPSKQEEIWSPENLKKIYDLLLPGGIFVTYCARGQVKRDLKAIGFEVESLAGPPGKKEMTRAVKPLQ